ncbi:MAG: KpsF/GutQ family sugar-phosphate isomerase [Verrucomicrobia bacterium]|nr:KpsF/GutQ family sugar-phosphate isomerase [Verrucomicrobiota bacterium]
MAAKVNSSPVAVSVSLARSVMEVEAEAIQSAAGRLDGNLIEAVELILAHRGKVIVSGLGKSGLIGQKIAATLCSTGTPAVYMHPAEALHGDLGVYSPGDPTILLSKSGSTVELVRLVPTLRQFQSPIIGILGSTTCALSTAVDVVLDASVHCEADPCNIAPTSSAIVALALGDALCCALMKARNFTLDDFARFHPGGQLGRTLLAKVREVFHGKACVATVRRDSTLKEVVVAMTKFPLGAACVAGAGEVLEGIITDGDLRRALQEHDDIRGLRAEQIMTRNPISISPDARLNEALRLMENRPSQISVLPVVDRENRCLGLLRIHDIYNPAAS